MRRAGQRLVDDAFHLLDFLHQVRLGRQPARGVGEHNVDAARGRGMDGIENHRRRIARLLRNHRHVVAFAPYHQLLARRGAESVAGREQDFLPLQPVIVGKLADRGGLAGAVDAGQHDHERLVRADIQGYRNRPQHFKQRLTQRFLQFGGLGEALLPGARAQLFQQVGGGRDTHVGGEQHGFQLVVEFLIELASRTEHSGQPRTKLLARLVDALLETGQPIAGCAVRTGLQET